MSSSLTFVPGSPADARFVADVFSDEDPQDPLDPAVVRLFYSNPAEVWARFRIEAAGRPVGFAFSRHHPWAQVPDRVARLRAGLLTGFRTTAALDHAYAFLEDHARRDGALLASAFVPEYDTVAVGALAGRGYVEDRRERFWELDLQEGGARLLALHEKSIARMREERISITTLALSTDPERLRRTYEMSVLCELDVPSSDTIVPDSYERFEEWLATPFIHEDRIFIAASGDEIVGLSTLAYPVERGIVHTDWTCVKSEVRNRGIARALKLETITQAIALGVDRIRTDNDFRNAPILHLNQDLGYRHIHDWLKLKLPLAPQR